MKKFALIVFSLILSAALLAGCSGRGNSPSAGEDPSSVNLDNASGSGSSKYSVAEAAANNAKLDEATVNLVQYQPVEEGDTIAVMETSAGTIRIKLFPELAPKAVDNFIGLADEGYYNGKNFHRVIENFMVQGGALNSDGSGGTSIYKNEHGISIAFEDEFTTDLWNFRGALCTANSGSDTNMSQFFIVQNSKVSEKTVQAMRDANFPNKVIDKYIENGGTPHFDWVSTVFGQVIEGMEIVDEIAAAETDDKDRPLEDIIIASLTIETAE